MNDAGHDALHTSELPEGNRTTDVRIAEMADGEGRLVVTKDRDFRDGHLARRATTVASYVGPTERPWRTAVVPR
ncbi:MAG: DUF5615 family PIN-like protein [Cryobacterium sp.]|nr:DUF5615 family PIN-like protein [Cryobacterium sp.]